MASVKHLAASLTGSHGNDALRTANATREISPTPGTPAMLQC